ncbi:hypothetical protein CMO92_00880 [Candidatus Woesearchaeota archaeon]|nr:hypothetical protein [Candidatus Woesearchaeota archaeon]|tara:strand:+ start:212 stop:637 length:426 start_codon:yes stop_codon:yes gene_type:complete
MDYLKQVGLINTNRELQRHFTPESMDSIQEQGQETIAVEISAFQEIYEEISHFRRYKELNNKKITELEQELATTKALLHELNNQTAKQPIQQEPLKQSQPLSQPVNQAIKEESNIEPSFNTEFQPTDVAVENVFNFSGKRV